MSEMLILVPFTCSFQMLRQMIVHINEQQMMPNRYVVIAPRTVGDRPKEFQCRAICARERREDRENENLFLT